MFKNYIYSLGARIPQIKRLLNEREVLRKECHYLEKEVTRLSNELHSGNQFYKDIQPHKIVVYTAIFGDKDDLKEPPMKLEGCDLVCFTDNQYLKSKAFDIRVYPSINSDPVRCARMFKVLPHWFFTGYEYSLWIDACVLFKRGDIQELINHYLREYNMAIFAHSCRDCIYDEADVCITAHKDNPEIIRQQVEQYREEGYPPHNRLVESTIILRKHLSADVIRIDEDWWSQIVKSSRRDQLSFNYVAWKNNFRWATIEGTVYNNDYFSVGAHKQ